MARTRALGFSVLLTLLTGLLVPVLWAGVQLFGGGRQLR
jgi:hypothetical protein